MLPVAAEQALGTEVITTWKQVHVQPNGMYIVPPIALALRRHGSELFNTLVTQLFIV